MKDIHRGESGAAVIWPPIFFIVATVSVYLAFQYLPAYIGAYRYKQLFSTVLHENSHRTDDDIRAELGKNLEFMDAPFKLGDIALTRVGDTVILDVLYEVVVEHPQMEPHVLKFNPHVEKEIPGHKPGE